MSFEQIELHKRVMKQIEAEPERWNQDTWSGWNRKCGTTFCYAGWAMNLSGFNLQNMTNPDDVQGKAAELLGLTMGEADEIFFWFPLERWDKDAAIGALKAKVTKVTGIEFD